jgi:Flp pilus assembly pilin Flp
MTYLTRLKKRALAWHRDENGSVAVETLLMVPLLAWAMLATITFFDAYRNEAVSFKAGLVIADAISREAEVDNAYINGLYGLHKFLMLKDDDPDLRITVFRFRADEGDYRRVWSRARGGKPALTNATLNGLSGILPSTMADGERAILVETWSEYDAPYAVGLGDFDMSTYNVVSPRFLPQACFLRNNGTTAC